MNQLNAKSTFSFRASDWKTMIRRHAIPRGSIAQAQVDLVADESGALL
jgi:hypothetical protein